MPNTPNGSAPSAWPASMNAGSAATRPLPLRRRPRVSMPTEKNTEYPEKESSAKAGEKMAILLKKDTTILVQGITGREGSARAAFMKGYGTKVLAGVTPGRGGEEVAGIPVFNTVAEAIRNVGPIDASVTFVPGTGLKA